CKSCLFYKRERQNRRLDSEHFRFAPRTCRSLCPRLDERKAERTGRSAALIAHRGGSPYASHEAARIHHAHRRRGSRVAARGARAAMARGSTGNAMKGIAEWLASICPGEYAQRFGESAIGLSVVRDLTEQDLKDLGVLLEHRRKMLRAIAELKGAAPIKLQAGPKAVPRDDAERRQLTVMFCDLV